MTELIGYISAILTTLSFLPQAIKTIKTRDTKGISLAMYLTYYSGLIGWFTYGILLKNPAIIISNAVIMVLAGIILYTKLKHS